MRELPHVDDELPVTSTYPKEALARAAAMSEGVERGVEAPAPAGSPLDAHLDAIVGTRAAKDVYPWIAEFLDRP